jgi:anti-sigma B factor antagonist/stage II sporulation protein AA (anti-sigma F factor antagonist)
MSEFQIRKINDITLISVGLVIATHKAAKLLWDELEKKSIFQLNKIVIDLSDCKYINSTFIGMLNKIYNKIIERDGQIKIVYPETIVIESQRTMSITKIVECYNNLDQALNSFDEKIYASGVTV